MQLEERAVGNVIVLAPSGRMTRNESFGVVKDRLQDLVEEGRRKLVLDLAAVSYMDSTCVGELVSGLMTVRKSGGVLRLANSTPRVERLSRGHGRWPRCLSIARVHGARARAAESAGPRRHTLGIRSTGDSCGECDALVAVDPNEPRERKIEGPAVWGFRKEARALHLDERNDLLGHDDDRRTLW